MNHEAYCAQILKVTEGESFISIGDKQLAKQLNPSYYSDLMEGRALSLPDLFSQRDFGIYAVFRLREVKFKLEERLVIKALEQLQSGIKQINRFLESSRIDRVEIVVPLKGRSLKKSELLFVGTPLDSNRYCLHFNGQENVFIEEQGRYPVSILFL
jgi:hypothetical protein